MCDKSSRFPKRLKEPKIIQIGEKNKHACILCNISFKKTYQLKKHKQSMIHSKKLSNFCYHGDETLPQTVNLIEHEMIHMGAKPYNCLQCSKKFSKR